MIVESFKDYCFFCSAKIDGKKSMEHIMPNGLLRKLQIQQTKVVGEMAVEYSRVKVASHPKCNNEFGSSYENKVLELLNDTDALYSTLLSEESTSIQIVYGPESSTTSILTTWLSKIYYGFFYHDLIKTGNDSWRETCLSIIGSENFKFVQRSYAHGHGFQLASSLYAFRTNNNETDFSTFVSPSCIMLKINTITLILCICDGLLAKNYLFGDQLQRLRDWVKQEDINNIQFPSHKLALAEILALLSCIPKTPKFVFSSNQVVNMSLSTMAANPSQKYALNLEQLSIERSHYLKMFNIDVAV